MFLRLLSADHIRQLFKLEVKSTVLAEILTALADCWLPNAGASQGAASGEEQPEAVGSDTEQFAHGAITEAAWVLRALEALSSSGRFTLTRGLLSKAVKGHVEQMFRDLREAAVSSSALDGQGLPEAEVVQLAALYGVALDPA